MRNLKVLPASMLPGPDVIPLDRIEISQDTISLSPEPAGAGGFGVLRAAGQR